MKATLLQASGLMPRRVSFLKVSGRVFSITVWGEGAKLKWREQPQRFSARYGARHPWLVSWPRAGTYLIWRAFVSGMRPLLVLALLVASIFFALLAARDLPRPLPAPLSDAERVEQAIFAAVPEGVDRHTWWVAQLNARLRNSRASMPDSDGVSAIAGAYTAVRGVESLGLELLSERRSRRLVEAELRAMPAWQRAQRIRRAVADKIDEGRLRGLSPPELIFAPEGLHTRLLRSERLYGPTLSEVESWFVDPAGRVLALDALPGLAGEPVRLYGDIRSLMVRFCALSLESERPVGQCRVGFLPKPEADPILAGLSLAVAGAGPDIVSGARIAKAAWAAGQLNPILARQLAFGSDARLGEAAALASATSLLVNAGEVWTQPARYEVAARSAADEASRAAGIDQRWRNQIFEKLANLRREVGALAALRLLGTVSTPEDIEMLVALSEASGDQVLALHLVTGADMLNHVRLPLPTGDATRYRRPGEWPSVVRQYAAIAIGVLLGALWIIAISLYEGFRRRRGRPPRGLERFDATMSRLILGRNP